MSNLDEGALEVAARAVNDCQFEDKEQAEYEWHHFTEAAPYARKLAKTAVDAYLSTLSPAADIQSPLTGSGETGWQDIASAPKDGRWIELWRGPVTGVGSWSPLVIGRWWVFDGDNEGTWAWPDETAVDPWHDPDGATEYLERGDCYDSTEHFTHWRPLSASPANTAETQDGEVGE